MNWVRSEAFGRVLSVLGPWCVRDMPLQGGPFTWSGSCNGRSMSHLDRFLVMADWEIQFSKAVQYVLPRPVFDHFPIMLDSEGIRSMPSPFRFELMWLKVEGFKDLLKDWWQNLQFNGSINYIMSAKLEALKGILKVWNRGVRQG